MPSWEQVRQYQQTTRNLAENAGLALKRQLRAYLGENPRATAAEAREYAKEAAAGIVTEFSQASGVLAEQLYATEFGSLPSGYIESVVNADAIDAAVRYRVGELVDGDVDGFVEDMGEWAAQASFNACNTRTLQLAHGKKSTTQMQRERRARRRAEHDTWFARVPSGVNTCTWCAMLASRGYVYWTEETAGKFSKWHDNCRCTVVATTRKGGIEGYDPTSWTYLHEVYAALDESDLPTTQRQAIRNLLSMYDIEDFKPADGYETLLSQYAKCAETVGLDLSATANADSAAIFAEASKRDIKWLVSGEPSEVVWQKAETKLHDHEKFAVSSLSNNGVPITVLDEDDAAPANIDLITRDGELWEMKDVGDGKHSVEGQLRDARKKWAKLHSDSPVRVVVTSTKATKSPEDVVAEIRRRGRYYDEAVYIDPDGQLHRV